MAHTTNELQEFITSEIEATERLDPAKRPAARAYLLGVQDAFEFLTTGRTSLGLADRDVSDENAWNVRQDPNKPARLPRGVTNMEPANPTVEGENKAGTPDVNQGNDHTGRKAIDHLKHAVQEHFTPGSGDPAERPLGLAGEEERVRRKR